MKRTLLLCSTATLLLSASAQTVLINESFEAYSVGAMPVSVNPAVFAFWPGGTVDHVITDSLAHGGNNSMSCIATSAGGGPADVLLKLGDETAGSYSLSWWMFVPSGFGGYFNIQHNEDAAPASYAGDFSFFDGGTVRAYGAGDSIDGSYPQDTWFQVNLFFDLTAMQASFLIGLTPVSTWDFNTTSAGAAAANQLGSINFYAYGGGGSTVGHYYVDDISYIQLPNISVQEVDGARDFSIHPVPTNALITITSGSQEPAQWRVIDMSGREVMTSTALLVPGSNSIVDISALAPGAYTMELTHGSVRERHAVVRN